MPRQAATSAFLAGAWASSFIFIFVMRRLTPAVLRGAAIIPFRRPLHVPGRRAVPVATSEPSGL